jgi:uncharacterized protein (TIGR02246 family)
MTDAAAKSTSKSSDEPAIRDLIARLYDAWARGDGDAYAACFTADADYVTFNGMHLHGRDENARVHSALFRSVLKGSRLSAEIESVAILGDRVALVHTAKSGRKASRQTFVLIRSDEGWRIRSFQNTRVQPTSLWLTRWIIQRSHP